MGREGSLHATELEAYLAPDKAMLSEFGWAFLINDTNRFLAVQFEGNNWSPPDLVIANSVLTARAELLRTMGCRYYKFIVPEKSVIYDEYLPLCIMKPARWPERPAEQLARSYSQTVTYLDYALRATKSYGLLYFRGDSHTNWMGAWVIYRSIINQLISTGVPTSAPTPINSLLASLVGWDGDILDQVGSDHRAKFNEQWSIISGSNVLETLLMFSLNSATRKAHPIECPNSYKEWFGPRETKVFERPDRLGLTAVIFRDSTLDFCVDLIAEHFARSVFIWHTGLVYEDLIRLERPSIVLHVMAERFVVMYPNFPAVSSIAAV